MSIRVWAFVVVAAAAAVAVAAAFVEHTYSDSIETFVAVELVVVAVNKPLFVDRIVAIPSAVAVVVLEIEIVAVVEVVAGGEDGDVAAKEVVRDVACAAMLVVDIDAS